jgi:hypothetical protein
VLVFLLVLAVIVIWAATLENGDPAKSTLSTAATGLRSVQAYFPAKVGMEWHYSGDGAEYADFSRRITAAAGDLVLVEDVTTATTVGAVYRVLPERAVLLTSVEEYSPEEHDLLQEVDGSAAAQRTPLQGPPIVGTRWEDHGVSREITAHLAELAVPAGTFYDVLEVKSISKEPDANYELTEYYAVNVGLIRRDFVSREGGASVTVSSSLQRYGVNQEH